MPTINHFTQAILNIFYQLTTIPRGSHDTGQMAAFLESFAKSNNYAIKKDAVGNILAYKENTESKVCFQCHYDMVCVGLAAQNLALNLVQVKRKKKNREQTWLKAQDSSLGADNGVGMSIMMYFMQQGFHAEFLFTNDEEVGMIGAKGLEIPIKSQILLNLDSEVLGEITISCAGGFDLNYQSEFITKEIPLNYHYYVLQSRNFVGGHSGLDINNPLPNYQNAILQSAYFLEKSLNDNEKDSLYVVNWQGGEKRNSIPMHSKLIIASEAKLNLESNEFFVFEELKEEHNELLDKTNEIFLQTPNGIEFKILYNLLLSLKIGVLHSTGKLVQSSRNLSRISFANGNLSLAFMCRANTSDLLEENLSNLKAILTQPQQQQKQDSLQINVGEYYAPWEKQDKNISSTLCFTKGTNECTQIQKPYTLKDIVGSMYVSMRKYTQPLNITPKIVELHAGLECGILLKRFHDLGLSNIIALSIGPSINAPHSINEEVWIESAGVIVAILQDFMEKL